MTGFANLYAALDATTKTTRKVEAMVDYFRSADPFDVAWAVALLTGRRPKRAVNSTRLQEWAAEEANIPAWLFSESYDAVGDLAETIALLLPEPTGAREPLGLARTMTERILSLPSMDEEARKAVVVEDWRSLPRDERFVYVKLLTGSFRVGVSQELVVRALAVATGTPAPRVSHLLMGAWTPSPEFLARLGAEEGEVDHSRPYPFMLAYALEADPETLGPVADWVVEWKWDGIRSQLIRRDGKSFVWSRGEDLITARFPEIVTLVDRLPEGTVIDGEILAFADGRPLPFTALQTRIGRKTITKKVLAESPVRLVAYDLLERGGVDLRETPFLERRRQLQAVLDEAEGHRVHELDLDIPPPEAGEPGGAMIADRLEAADWSEVAALRATAREHGVEGLMLKRASSAYLVGRRKGDWWKWKVDPLTVDAVLVYAQRGTGKRASLYTDYTFAVWKDGALVPFAKAYSGLTDAEIAKVDAWIRRHTKESFGPVRTVEPVLVMELGFEGIQLSNRHKSGLAVRFPRILRWRQDKSAPEADTLETVRSMIESPG